MVDSPWIRNWDDAADPWIDALRDLDKEGRKTW
jgi:hypothetical protein